MNAFRNLNIALTVAVKNANGASLKIYAMTFNMLENIQQKQQTKSKKNKARFQNFLKKEQQIS